MRRSFLMATVFAIGWAGTSAKAQSVMVPSNPPPPNPPVLVTPAPASSTTVNVKPRWYRWHHHYVYGYPPAGAVFIAESPYYTNPAQLFPSFGLGFSFR